MIFPLLIIAFIFSPLMASAAPLFPTIEAPLSVEVIPSAPVPGQVVQIKASYATENPDGTNYVWRVNGAVVDQGIGRKAITVTAGTLGSSMSVSVTVSVDGSVKGERTVTIQPSSVDIVWEAQTTRIPFVANLPLPNGDSTITAIAIPQIIRTSGVRVSADDLVYTWKINRSSTPSLSGYGKDTFTFSSPQFKNPFTVSVLAKTREGDIQAEETITIRPIEPTVLFYENAPLLGIRFDRAINESITLQGEEVTVSAFPLSISDSQPLVYEWLANGQSVTPSPDDSKTITFRKTGEGKGYFTIQLSVSAFQALFERTKQSFLLTF